MEAKTESPLSSVDTYDPIEAAATLRKARFDEFGWGDTDHDDHDRDFTRKWWRAIYDDNGVISEVMIGDSKADFSDDYKFELPGCLPDDAAFTMSVSRATKHFCVVVEQPGDAYDVAEDKVHTVTYWFDLKKEITISKK